MVLIHERAFCKLVGLQGLFTAADQGTAHEIIHHLAIETDARGQRCARAATVPMATVVSTKRE